MTKKLKSTLALTACTIILGQVQPAIAYVHHYAQREAAAAYSYAPPVRGWAMRVNTVQFWVDWWSWDGVNVTTWAAPTVGQTPFAEVGYHKGWLSAWWKNESYFYNQYVPPGGDATHGWWGNFAPTTGTDYLYWIFKNEPDNGNTYFLVTDLNSNSLEGHGWSGTTDYKWGTFGIEAWPGTTISPNSIDIKWIAWWPWNDWNIYWPSVPGTNGRNPDDSSNHFQVNNSNYGFGNPPNLGIHIYRN